MARVKIQPKETEVPFKIEDLIFSTTDEKGIIRSTNDVFLTMARYSPEEVLGEPHNIVRHPTMPKAVFHLYWNYIKQGKPIGAYVTNIASDGSYYRVYTLATPLQDGYLAIRFKTTSKYRRIVADLYQEMCEFEAELSAQGKTTAELVVDSTALLNDRLHELGFSDYDSFMNITLEEEMRCRDVQIRQAYSCDLWQRGALSASDVLREPVDPRALLVLHLERCCSVAGTLFSKIGSLLSLQDQLNANAAAVMNVSKAFEMSSINVSLEATRLGKQAECLSVIANHLGESSQRVCDLALSTQSQILSTSESLGRAVFCIAATRLQFETMLDFSRKNQNADVSSNQTWNEEILRAHPRQRPEAVMVDLLHAVQSQQNTLMPTMKALIDDLITLESNIVSVKRSMLMMRFAQLGGKIESSRLDSDNDISTLVDSIGEDIVKTVRQISELESDLATVATDLRTSFRQLNSLDGSLGDVREAAEALSGAAPTKQAA